MGTTTRKTALFGLTVLLVAGVSSAQEPKPQPSPESQEPQAQAATEGEEAKPQQPPAQIRVLQHPYDLASFYRSSQGYGVYGAYGVYGYGLYRSSMDHSDRYPLARYYRAGAQNPGGYSRFWTSGYGWNAGPRLG